MGYLITDPKPVETDVSCKGCGADLLVTTDWMYKEIDEDLLIPVYDMEFVSVSCSMNKDYGCICSDDIELASLDPKFLLEQVIDHWCAAEEKRMEMYH